MRLTLLNKRGIGIVEVLLVTAITSLLMGSIFYLLSVAQSSRALSTAKSEVQSEVRRAMDWIINDLRQTVSGSIGSKDNNPLSTHIKFQKFIGYSVKAGIPSPDFGNFIEYTYDSNSKTITRTDFSTNQSWVFRNIIYAPFYTRISNGVIAAIDPVNPGENSPVFKESSANLVIDIRGQKQVSPTLNASYTLKEEVAIRI